MAHQLTSRSTRLFSVPIFLAPSFSNTSLNSLRPFSTSPQVQNQVKRGGRDKNKKRGVSAIRSTGPRRILSVAKLGPLPKPVSDRSEALKDFPVIPDHGLWGFFNDNKEALIPSNEEDAHGRAWTTEELSQKGWSDLHKLYWVCVKEANIVRTRNNERDRLSVGYGSREADERLGVLAKTMRNIRQALVERHYARFDASQLLATKTVYEIFPEILHRYVDSQAPELLETGEVTQEELLSTGNQQKSSSDEDSEPLLAREDVNLGQKATHQPRP